MNQYRPQIINGTMHVWLQEVGFYPAKRGAEIRVGDRIAYNWGYAAQVVSIDKTTAKSRTVSVREGDGKIYQQRIMNDGWKPIFQTDKEEAKP